MSVGSMWKYYGPTSVPFAFILVTKQINTIFFADKYNPCNLALGTVIDSVVTDPTKYVVLYKLPYLLSVLKI